MPIEAVISSAEGSGVAVFDDGGIESPAMAKPFTKAPAGEIGLVISREFGLEGDLHFYLKVLEGRLKVSQTQESRLKPRL